MEQKEMIELAKKAIEKNWDYDAVYYGDDLYGHEEDAEQVWDYIAECKLIGMVAFDEKYKAV